MNIEKIEINGHYVWVDKDAKIEQDDNIIRYSNNELAIANDEWAGEVDVVWGKIIAASPELNLEGVPTT